jgi:hypothetical protein
MAGADELLRDAQYAVQCISHGDTRENRAHTSEAKSLARKIIRKYPVSIEATQARAILDRLNGTARPHKFTKLRDGVVQGQQRDTGYRTLAKPSGSATQFSGTLLTEAGSPQQLLLEAKHALHSISDSSSAGERDFARVTQLAARVVKEYADSDEAQVARQLLNKVQRSERLSEPVETDRKRSAEATPDWQQILVGFRDLDQNRQVYVGGAIFVLAMVVGIVPIVLVALIIYFAGPIGKLYPPGFRYIHDAILKHLNIWLEKNKAQ